MTAKSGWTRRGLPSALAAGEAVRGSTDKPPMRPKGGRCCLELGPLRGCRRGEGRGCQGRECKRLIAPRGEVEVVWSCSCRNRAVVALDGQDKDAPVHRTASHCSARPITPGRIVVTLRFFLVGFSQRADAYNAHLLEGFSLRLDTLIPLQDGAQQVLAAGGE